MELAEKLKKLPLDMADPDPCCGKALAKALQSGALADKPEWTHEKCGCRWKAEQMPPDGSRLWYPVVEVWIL